MKIESSSVNMNGYSESNRKTTVQMASATVTSNSRLGLNTQQANDRLTEGNVDSLFSLVYVSEEGRSLSSKSTTSNTLEGAAPQNREGETENKTEQKSIPKWNVPSIRIANGQEQIQVKSLHELKREMLERLISAFWGKGKQIKIPSLYDKFQVDPNKNLSSAQSNASGSASQTAQGSQNQAAGNPMFNYVSNIQKTSIETSEQEKMSFNSQISVKTSDGRTINVNLELNLSRELYFKAESTSVTETLQRLCDPLVINFGAASAELTDVKFSFDLDCDGKSDQISELAKGSGFLALDLNGDDTINDGSELFGAKSGNGFADLAKYDKDGNGWIDENDEIFDKLRIWTKDGDDKDVLLGLGEVGIGAIYLGYADTSYSLKNDGALNGIIQKTGIFLREDGTAGTVQHVDLAV